MSTAKAEAWLRHQFADGGKPANVIRTEAEAADHSWASVRRAKDLLNIKSERRDDQWFWSLPDQLQGAQAHAGAVQDAHAQGAQSEQDAQAPMTETQGAPQGAQITAGVAQDAHALADLAQDAQRQDAQDAQSAQGVPPKRGRNFKVRARGLPARARAERTHMGRIRSRSRRSARPSRPSPLRDFQFRQAA